jgi:hypothetical protein
MAAPVPRHDSTKPLNDASELNTFPLAWLVALGGVTRSTLKRIFAAFSTSSLLGAAVQTKGATWFGQQRLDGLEVRRTAPSPCTTDF